MANFFFNFLQFIITENKKNEKARQRKSQISSESLHHQKRTLDLIKIKNYFRL